MENPRGVEFLPNGSSQGGFWASALGGVAVGALGGYLAGGGSANRNLAFRNQWAAAAAPAMVPFGHEHGVSRFDLEQSEKISKLEIELAKKDAVIGCFGAVKESNSYTDHRLHHEISELKEWATRQFIAQPTVTATVSGASLEPANQAPQSNLQ